MNGTEKLKELINGSNNIVYFGGAGVSTESGIPDFEVRMDFITRSMIIRRKPF